MPTAVERWLDAFLKLDALGGREEQASLNSAFLKIEDDFLKLSDPNADTFHKFDHKHKDEVTIGDFFIKLGGDFSRIAAAGSLIDSMVLKLVGSPTAPTTDSTDGAPNPQADFLKLDQAINISVMDLKNVGVDFLKLHTSPTLEVFQGKVMGIGNDFLKIKLDMAADRDDFLKLGADFLKLGGVDNPSPLDLAYKELGGELQTVGQKFDALATDFLNLGQAVQATGGAGAGKGMIGADFMTLNQDFHKLDTALGGLADGAAMVIGDLLPKSFMGGDRGS